MTDHSESLELATSGRAKCKLCKKPIPKASLRMGLHQASSQFDGDMTFWHHALCAALRRPAPMLRALARYEGATPVVRQVIESIAMTAQARKVKQVLWSHPTRERCIVEFAGDRYVLFTDTGNIPLVVEGTLDEALASVPDEDFEAATDAITATGKPIGAAAKVSHARGAPKRAGRTRAIHPPDRRHG